MSVYKLFWILFKEILRGKGNSSVFFDTEARTYEYHLALVGYAGCSDMYGDGTRIDFILNEATHL